MAGGRTVWDQLIDGMGDTITDIREKLVEEPWYGRTLDVPLSDLAPSRQIEPPQGTERAFLHAPSHTPAPEHDDAIER